MSTAPIADWPLDQIQGLLLRGYPSNFARHFALSIADGEAAVTAAKDFIYSLTAPEAGQLGITTAAPWASKPPCRLNISFTYPGLQALGVAQESLAIFSGQPGQVDSNYVPFAQGAKKRAWQYLNEPNAGEWELSDRDFDLMVSVWADSLAELDLVEAKLHALTPGTFAPFGGQVFDGHAFDANIVYFGYEDSISQPIIANSPFTRPPDDQDPVDPSAFLIGEGANIYSALPFDPERFGKWGCFSGFLVLRQDVDKFDAQVAQLAPQLSTIGVQDEEVQKEALMAAMCGRWRNGVSLTRHPIQGDVLPPPFDEATANDYHYVEADNATPDMGTVCPIGAHMRRGNMRLRAADAPLPPPFLKPLSSQNRIMRRAMPYQSPHLAADRHNSETERGLVGHFLGASLLHQFEQVFGQWMNAQFFIDGEMTDALIGVPDPGNISIPSPTAQASVGTDVQSIVTTRAAAYVFFPGIDGIRFLAGR